MKSRWFEMAYWRWVWRRVPWEARGAVVGVVLLGLLGGGWALASQATSSNEGEVAVGTGPIVVETTVEKVVTVREHGKIVRKIVPVVKRVRVVQRAGTVYETQRDYVTRVVKTPGKSLIRTRTVSTVVPVVTTRQITVNGKPRLVTRTQFVTTTQTKTVPITQTVVATQNVTQVQTAPPVTDTKTTTQTKTQTQTQTVTQTATRTVTDTQVVTVTPDPVTVTRTVTVTETPDPVTVTRTETDTVTVTVHDDPPPP
jgi:hypothetical protein